jgi:hypothetical protein
MADDIEMIPVSSSQIAAVGYDANTQELRVAFVKGGLYSYDDVPAEVFENLKQAASVGSYFHDAVKGAYNYNRLS